MDSPNAIEVVHGETDQNLDNMVFTHTNEGYKVDEEALQETSNAEALRSRANKFQETPTSGRIADDKLPVEDTELI